jgi:5-methylcytosine-specific restriction endonuclease McrA
MSSEVQAIAEALYGVKTSKVVPEFDRDEEVKRQSTARDEEAERQSTAQDEEAERQSTSPDDSTARKSFSKKDVETVWETYLGNTSEEICPLCGENRIIFNDRSTWEMSHIQAHAKKGSCDLSNIRPLCFKCNRSMGSMHLRQFMIERYQARYHTIMQVLKL